MKKLNTKGFTHHVGLFVILALVLGAMGFAGYRVWQNSNKDAQAKGSTTLQNYNGFVVRACKSKISADGGGRWKINLTAKYAKAKKFDKILTPYSFDFYVESKGSLASTTSFILERGKSGKKVAYAYTGDKYSTAAGSGGMGGGGPFSLSASIASLKSC